MIDRFLKSLAAQTGGSFCTRREMLVQSGLGMGVFGLASLLGSAQAGDAIREPAGPQAAAVSGPRQAHHSYLPQRRPVARRHVRSQAVLARYAGKQLPNENLRTERKTGAAFPSPFKFKKYGQSGIEISELFSHLGQHADDLCVIRSMHADVPNHEPSLMLMNCGDADAAAAQRRLVAHLRPGDREPEPAGVRRPVPARLPDQGHRELAVGLFAGQLPGNLCRHAVHPGRQADRQHPQPDDHVQSSSAASST